MTTLLVRNLKAVRCQQNGSGTYHDWEPKSWNRLEKLSYLVPMFLGIQTQATCHGNMMQRYQKIQVNIFPAGPEERVPLSEFSTRCWYCSRTHNLT